MIIPRRRLIPLFALLAFALLFATPRPGAPKRGREGQPQGLAGGRRHLLEVKTGDDARLTGGALNDELLGHHGSDRIAGGAGHDILWGDWDPRNNNGTQRDVLRGGAGNDWIYPSHGRTTVLAGKGKDRVWAFYGRGTIDCGPGRDTVRVRMNGAFRLKQLRGRQPLLRPRLGRPRRLPEARREAPARLAACSSRENAASNATVDGAKSVRRTNASASSAPHSRSIPTSSHSIDSGPS